MKMITQNAEKVQMADTISRFIKRFRGYSSECPLKGREK